MSIRTISPRRRQCVCGAHSRHGGADRADSAARACGAAAVARSAHCRASGHHRALSAANSRQTRRSESPLRSAGRWDGRYVSPRVEVRGTLERARYMTSIAPTALADMDSGTEVGLSALRTARALGVVFTRGRLELSVPDRREQRGAGADGRQRRGAEALGTDAAVRGSIRRVLRRRGAAVRPSSRCCTLCTPT